MPIGTGVPGEDFSARVIFRAPGINPQFWAVTHEFSSNGGGTTDTQFENFANCLSNFHRALLYSGFQVDRVVISTLAQDSAPYDVTKLAVFEYAAQGTRAGAGDVLPLANCLLVKRIVANGRLGNMLLRGMLGETDHSSPGGIPQLADPAGLQDEIDAALDASELASYISADVLTGQLQLYMITPGTLNNIERPIVRFQVARLTNKKLNNKYFDKGIL